MRRGRARLREAGRSRSRSQPQQQQQQQPPPSRLVARPRRQRENRRWGMAALRVRVWAPRGARGVVGEKQGRWMYASAWSTQPPDSGGRDSGRESPAPEWPPSLLLCHCGRPFFFFAVVVVVPRADIGGLTPVARGGAYSRDWDGWSGAGPLSLLDCRVWHTRRCARECGGRGGTSRAGTPETPQRPKPHARPQRAVRGAGLLGELACIKPPRAAGPVANWQCRNRQASRCRRSVTLNTLTETLTVPPVLSVQGAESLRRLRRLVLSSSLAPGRSVKSASPVGVALTPPSSSTRLHDHALAHRVLSTTCIFTSRSHMSFASGPT